MTLVKTHLRLYSGVIHGLLTDVTSLNTRLPRTIPVGIGCVQ